MPRVNPQATRFNLIQFFRNRRSARPQNYGSISVRVARPRNAQVRLNSARPRTSIFNRRARNTFTKSTGISGTDAQHDAQRFVSVLKNNKAEAILGAAWQTATHPELEGKHTYQGEFFTNFQEEIGTLSTRQLQQLHKNLNSGKMTSLRSGMANAGEVGFFSLSPKEAALQMECASTSRQLEAINRAVVAEMSGRGVTLPDEAFTNASSEGDWQQEKRTRNTLQKFAAFIEPKITSQSGDLPYIMFESLEQDFQNLCAQARINPAGDKEPAVTHSVLGDKSSTELNVSELYIRDVFRGHRLFVSADGEKTSRSLGLTADNRQEISDHLTDFCKGSVREARSKNEVRKQELSANQARRLQALLTQQSVAPLHDGQAHGKLGSPERGREMLLLGSGISDYRIERLSNGNIQLDIKQKLNPQHYNPMDRPAGGDNLVELDGKRSFIETNVSVIIPRRMNAAPVLEDATYTTHLIKQD